MRHLARVTAFAALVAGCGVSEPSTLASAVQSHWLKAALHLGWFSPRTGAMSPFAADSSRSTWRTSSI